ncbi:MAG: type III pantothenate kinase [Cyclobacteriaceae bacterium]
MAIDIGNTRTKVGIFKSSKLTEVLVDPAMEKLPDHIKKEQIDKVIISSVGHDPQKIVTELDPKYFIILDHNTEVPLVNGYSSPQTLGMDRLAAVVGAQARFPKTNCLVIDAGTSITYDFVDLELKYHGGAISPGIDLRYRALNDHTQRLPLLSDKTSAPLIGADTKSAIKSGVLNGVLAEIEGIIHRYEQKFSNLQVIMCGGDAAFFESMVKAPIFVIPNLVLVGLNVILQHNVQKN